MGLPAMGLRRLFSSRSTSLRSQLTVLVLAILIPLVTFSGLVLYLLAHRERDTFEHGVKDRARAVLTAVDTELKSSISTLLALASLSHFDRDDLQSFRQEAVHVLNNEPNWLTIDLAVPSGRQVMNLQRSSDAVLAMTRERRSFDKAQQTAKPVVGDMLQSDVTHTQEFSVRVPIIRNGVIKYVLSAVIDPQSIEQLLLAQKLPPDWVGVIVDADGHLVGETVPSQQSVGEPAFAKLKAAFDRASEGWFQSKTANGRTLYIAYSHSSFSGWTVALAIAPSIISAPFRGPVLYLVLCAIFLLIAGSLFASWLSSKTAASIEALVRMVTDLGVGKVSGMKSQRLSNLAEIEQLKDAFLTARSLIQERSEERDRFEEALADDIQQRIRAERFLLLQIAISRILADSSDLQSAAPKIIQAICELTEWEVGAIWEANRITAELTLVDVWHVTAMSVPEVESATRQIRLAAGAGLPGRVWASGDPAWIPDMTKEPNSLPTALAIKETLHSGVCFPIKIDTEVLGVVECFSREIRSRDAECLETLANLGHQIGQFLERKRAERYLAESMHRRDALYHFLERRQQATSVEEIYDAALDGILAALRCERAAILWHDASRVMRFVAWRGLSETCRCAFEGHAPWRPDEDDPQPVCILDVGACGLNQVLKSALMAEGIGALAFIPVMVHRTLTGKLAIYFDAPRTFDEIELELSLTIARQLAIGIERNRDEEALKKFNEDLERLVAQRTKGLMQLNAELVESFSEREKLQEQLRQSQKMEALGTLASGVAHDFNNILNIIQAYASVIGERRPNTESAEELSIIKDMVRRGSALVQQLLTVARKSGGAERELIDVNVLVQSLVPLIRQTFPKTIELNCLQEPNLASIIADRSQIEQAVLNLCVNARDAMPNGGTLILKTHSVDAALLQRLGGTGTVRSYVGLEVSDSGLGIDESIRERIFEPFFTTKDKGQGTGLGLSVVYGIMKNHNGFVEVQSKPMGGSSFRLYFPAASVEEIAETRHGDGAPVLPASDITAGTVLIAEDEISMLHFLERILVRRGYKILKAADGQAALELYRRHKDKIIVILLDIGLPKLSGGEVLLKIRAENPDVKVIVTSGYLDPTTKAQIDGTQVRFLDKPYTPTDVFKTLQSLTEALS